MAKTSKLSKIPRAVQAYESIHERIITMDFKPGQYLDEKMLVSELGIGRTPIREALLRLASEALVESQPNKGFIVTPLTIQNVKAMFEALRIMEIGAASLSIQLDPTRHLHLLKEAHEAVKKAIKGNDLLSLVWSNHDFHMRFARSSANEYLVRALRSVRNEANRLAYLSFGSNAGLNTDLHDHYRSVNREHEQIMDYLRDRNLEQLKATIEAHILTFQGRVVRYLTTPTI